LLVLQDRDTSPTTHPPAPGKLTWLTSKQGTGEPHPSWIPEGTKATRILASLRKGGLAGGVWSEVVDIPLTAHFLGGCSISSSPDDGVVDLYHRVWGLPGLYVVDGSAMQADHGVNLYLCILANQERGAGM